MSQPRGLAGFERVCDRACCFEAAVGIVEESIHGSRALCEAHAAGYEVSRDV